MCDFMARETSLRYNSPARQWTEALPVGNGRLGAMVFGGIEAERIQLNEDSVWSGGYRNRNNPEAKTQLDKIRALLQAGDVEEAEKAVRYSISGTPEYQRTYQTLGDLYVTFHNIPKNVQSYTRTLNLEEAVSATHYMADGHAYEREVFASAPSDIIALRLTTTNPDGMSFDARLIRERFCENTGKVDDCTVFFDGINGGDNGISFCCMMTGGNTGGNLQATGEYLVFQNVTEACIYITARTNYRSENPAEYCKMILGNVKQKTYEEMRAAHVKDYMLLEQRVSICLNSSPDNAALPTDERLIQFRENPTDMGLVELYFRYGRYLLISSSRPGTLPANLQGIWCDEFKPPWDSKYTINVNAQMNYWAAETCHLSECHLPLLEHIKSIHKNGIETARSMYGARGFAAHHNTDIWGDTAPQDTCGTATYWVMGAAWLCLHIWEHYQYTLDNSFLGEYYYLLKDACLFFVDFLTENGKGELVVSPTVSPENTYILPSGKQAALCAGCSMDTQILHELFTACAEACVVLNKDRDFADILIRMISKLPPIRVGKHGSILEWVEDYEETEPGHRHISHLFALFPGTQISPEKTPVSAAAARKTLERRLSNGGGHTGWSRAWIVNFWARLGDAEKSLENINLLLSGSTLPNMFDNHPPFQIDGNFGGTAAIANMLLQSDSDAIYLLKALPEQWREGCITGLRAKGGLTVDLTWKNGGLYSAKLTAKNDYSGRIIYGESEVSVKLSKGEHIHINSVLQTANTWGLGIII